MFTVHIYTDYNNYVVNGQVSIINYIFTASRRNGIKRNCYMKNLQ